MIGHLKDIFPNVPIFVLLATITPIVLEYICKSLKFYLATRLYRESLDRANITYMVSEILKSNFKDFSFLMPNNIGVNLIPKTMIFVDCKMINLVI